MKKYAVIISLFALVITLSAKDTKVPREVQEAFAKLYPSVSDVHWDKEGADQFEAEFLSDGTKTSVIFNGRGELEETETAIDISDLPAIVIPYVTKNYDGYKITEAARIVDEEGSVTYEAEISKDKEKKDLLFDKDGNPLNKKTGIPESEEED